MFRRLLLPAILALSLQAQDTGPSYSAAGIVNGATNLPGPLAPNTWTTLYGKNLSWSTAAAGPSDMAEGHWPTRIPGVGVQVMFAGGSPAHLSYVSPTEIRFLTPVSRAPGSTTMYVVRDGYVGPVVTVVFAAASPGLYQTDSMASATHADGSLLRRDSPARPGEIVVLYGTGLGQISAPLDNLSDGRIETSTDTVALRIQNFADLRVTFDDTALDPQRIQWAGVTPGFAGLYQVNLQLPDTLGADPEVRVWIGDQGSAPGIRLPVQP